MDFSAERVSELNCGRCGERIDPSGPKPLTILACPRCGARVRVPAVFGDFLLGDVLGTGAAGIVCKALDQQLHRHVAIKILRKSDTSNELVEQCTREARALAALNHPHVVQVHSIGEYRGQPFIVMELLDGGDVQRSMIGKLNDEGATLDVAIDTAEGLAAAHRAGLVHMDVKPGNILYSRAGVAKVIDFGVAQVARRAGDAVAGTPYYVAPEVIRGQPADFKADIYSLGSTLFHLLAGRPPFEAESVERLLKRKLKHDPPDLLDLRKDLHPATAAVVNRMIAADPAHRHASYDELLAELRAAKQAAETPAVDFALHQLANATMTAAASVKAPEPPAIAIAPEPAPPVGDDPADAPITRSTLGKRAGLAVATVVLLIAVGLLVTGGDDAIEKAHSPDPQAIITDSRVVPAADRSPIGIPASAKVGFFADDSRWKSLTLKRGDPTQGANWTTLDDGSALFLDEASTTSEYVLTGSTDLPSVYAIGIEVMPDDSLDRGGPGIAGNFYLAEVRAAIAPRSEPSKLAGVSLVKPVASYAQEGFPIESTLDGDLKSAWAIGNRFGRAHTATFPMERSVSHAGGCVVQVTLTHHPDFKQHIGRVRLWVSNDLAYRPAEEVALAAKPDTPPAASTPKPAPTPPPPQPKPAPPPPTPSIADHAPLYTDPAMLADQGDWSTLDIIRAESSGGSTLTKRADGSILVSGEHRPDDVYTLTVRTSLKGITAFRLDAEPDASLPSGGPGRNKGTFVVKGFTVAAGPDAASAATVKLESASSAVNRQGFGAANVLAGRDNGWANPDAAVNRSMTMLVEPAEEVGEADSTTLVFTIAHRGPGSIGRFRLGATTGDPKSGGEMALLKRRSDIGFVALKPTDATAAREAKFDIRPDGSVFVESRFAINNAYTMEFDAPSGAITMLRLEALTDEALPKSGPGLPPNGAFAIFEIDLKAAPLSRPGDAKPVALTSAVASHHEDGFPPAHAIDGAKATFWAMIKRAGEPHEITFRPRSPIDHKEGTRLTVTITQKMALGGLRLSVTTMPDPTPLSTKPKDGAAPDGGQPGDAAAAGGPVQLYFNFGGTDVTDDKGRKWIKAASFRAGGAGYKGRPTNEFMPGHETSVLASSAVSVSGFRATVPDGVYNVVLHFGPTNKDLVAGKRRFAVTIEGQQVSKEFDVYMATRGNRSTAALQAKVRVDDGVLDIEFLRLPPQGTTTSLSAVSIIADR